MPEDKLAKAEGEAPQAPAGTTLRVHSQDVKTSYANMCLLLSTREELILDFGLTLMGGPRDQREANMAVSNRIIMTPAAAKRLAIALSQAIQRHENTFGVIEIEPRVSPAQVASRQ